MERDFTTADLSEYLKERRNWGRWGSDDQLGAGNMITPEVRLSAGALIRTGLTLSLSRPLPTESGPANPHPFQHYVKELPGSEGGVVDFYGAFYHGVSYTHIDALNHLWGPDGMWNGREPSQEVGFNGVSWADVDTWSNGILTRGVLLDVPLYRGAPYVTMESPVSDSELAAIAARQGVETRPGDALIVYSGRAAWDVENPPWGSEHVKTDGGVVVKRPGLHASCIRFIRDSDASVLVWDMMDHKPNEFGVRWTVHAVLSQYGVALVDNALLEPLAQACAEAERYEFALVLAPLRVIGGTGSPINPIAIF